MQRVESPEFSGSQPVRPFRIPATTLAQVRSLGLVRALADNWQLVLVLTLTGAVHIYGMWSFPAYDLDEGSILGQAWAVLHLGKLDPYTYWYDHPPLGWIFLSPFLWAMTVFGYGTSALERGRVIMLAVDLASTFCLFQIVLRLTGNKTAALLAALAVALSPLALTLHRMTKLDNIANMWTLAAFYVALSRRPSLSRVWLSAILLVIGTLSKEPGILFAPAVAYAVAQRVDDRRRLLAVAGWTGIFVLGVSFYPLFALLKGELFPYGWFLIGGSKAHVSLLGSLAAGRPAGGLQNQSSFVPLLRAWWGHEPILITAGLAAVAVNTVAALKDRRARLAALLVLPYLLFLARGGLIRDYWLVPLLPSLAINIAVAAPVAVGWSRRVRAAIIPDRRTPEEQQVEWEAAREIRREKLRQWATGASPEQRQYAQLRLELDRAVTTASQSLAHRPRRRWAPAVLSVVAVPLLVAGIFVPTPGFLGTYHRQLADLFTVDSTTSYHQSLDWIRQNIDPSSSMVIDSSFYIDLQETPSDSSGRGPFTRAYHYWVVAQDPAVRTGVFQDDWRTADYVVMTPAMLADAIGGSVPLVADIINHSTLVAEFSSGTYWVRILKVQKDETAAASAPIFRPPARLLSMACNDSVVTIETATDQFQAPTDCNWIPTGKALDELRAGPVSVTAQPGQPWGTLRLEGLTKTYEFRVGQVTVTPASGTAGSANFRPALPNAGLGAAPAGSGPLPWLLPAGLLAAAGIGLAALGLVRRRAR